MLNGRKLAHTDQIDYFTPKAIIATHTDLITESLLAGSIG